MCEQMETVYLNQSDIKNIQLAAEWLQVLSRQPGVIKNEVDPLIECLNRIAGVPNGSVEGC
jgi:hypothetical protein